MTRVGILAYGSLIDDPGEELRALVESRIDNVETPFSVEFARKSSSRDGAPTLVPVTQGGAPVKATILVLKKDVDLGEARSMLWRRETRREGTYDPPANPTPNTVLVDEIKGLANVEVVLSTRIGANINPLNVAKLANLAIASAKAESGAAARDGISYLIIIVPRRMESPRL